MINPNLRIQKILFINPYPVYASGINEATIYPPLGMAYIAATLEKDNLECKIIDAAVLKLNQAELIAEIRKFKPDAIGISTNIVTAKAGVELGKVLRQKFSRMLLIYGGPYATAESDLILRNTGADIVVFGEGEATMEEITKNLRNLKDIKGIVYRHGAKIIRNPPRELIADLDSIPFPAYHLLPNFRLYHSRSRKTPIGFLVTSRGCPFGCIFCNKNIFGRRFRMRSAANVLTEIELLVGRYKVKQIDVLDDNFTLHIPRAEKICDEIIKRKIQVLLNFQNGVRADRLTPRLIHKMRQAGTYKAGIGIESGDPRIQKIIKKSLSLPKVARAVRMLRKEGIVVVGFFMIGLPGDNPQSLTQTINFAKKVNPHIANFSVVVPLPQTELYEIIKNKGKFITDTRFGSESGFYSDHFNFELGAVNKKLIRTYVAKAYREFYLRPGKIIDMMLSIKSPDELRWIIDAAKPLVRYLCQ